ncbi:thiamin pyrophosphokinase 1-like [Stegodyphus dumicola]|uniref:thiamin pyrophosphokinase 1-like n=1 Tax=Stegodyphus dumicola TaxID=202533 RepID=UPI0015AA1592|nr:thiamin pyrophosphokinase 1-like [Stegodyphus dumicola]XP_035221321.1 thiamin pyrophosphokinase 1-like [Stegodyphus dumicola]
MHNNSESQSQWKEWFPHCIINGEHPFCLLILNQLLNKENEHFLKKNWRNAAIRIAVDGGACQLKSISDEELNLIPDVICGDFDSVTPDVLDYYQNKGVEIVHTPDQDETDFTKAVRLAVQYIAEKKLQVSAIVAVARNGERLDHILGNLNTLYTANEITSIPVFILGHGSLTWLFCPGSHKVHITDDVKDSHLGLIPLGKECTNVSTTGLKWNLNGDRMKFGGLISTCNLFDGSSTVTVTTDTELIWTMEIKLNTS